MKRIIITGGVACGKTTVFKGLKNYFEPLSTFDSDACVKEILTKDDSKRWISENFGKDYVSSEGVLNRSALRNLIFNDELARKKLESYLHPQVRAVATDLAKAAEDLNEPRFLFDIPLYFETGKQYPSDLLVSVLCSPQTQIERLYERDQASEGLARQMLDAQWPTYAKITDSDVVIWNDGGRDALEKQIFLLAQILKQL